MNVLRTVVCFFCLTIAGCNPSKKAPGSANTGRIVISRSDSLSGLEVVKQSDCYTCHRVAGKLQGPSFSEMAQRYEADINTINKLSSKIINGGLGSWGRLPMVPHPILSREEAQDAVKYILSLKNK